MAGRTQRLSRESAFKAPTSDDGTLLDEPLTGTPSDDEGFDQPGQAQYTGQQQQDEPPNDEIGPLGSHVKEALSIASSLAQLALDNSELSIPRCVVLGQQSTGKSSVIEAISGIKTPRDTGTCTRCPMFIDMQSSDDPNGKWQAEVYLLRQFDVHQVGQEESVFQGWTPALAAGKIPFAQTTNPEQLEELIACAQRATLSPMLDHKLFLDPNYRNVNMHKTLFSPNPVGISIRKPGFPSLSFFDLPGLIAQAETEDEEFTVSLVENLVSMYVQDPEALILVTTALENDIATSTAARIARRLKATNRCIGVLTKPDRLAPGTSPKDLARTLDGQTFALGHGYFVVRNLDQKQIQQRLTHANARQIEQEFFSTSTPWADELHQYRHRFGTLNLQQYLSMQLGKQVIAKLPEIHKKIQAHLEAVEAELSQIPEIPLHTATRTVCDVLQAFTADVSNEISGDHGYETWEIMWAALKQKLWTALKDSKPTMKTAGTKDEGIYLSALPGGSSDAAIMIDDCDDSSDVPDTPSKKRKHDDRAKRETQTPAPFKSSRVTPKKPIPKPPQARRTTASSTNTAVTADSRKIFNLDEVAAHVSQSSKGRVSGGLHPKARENLMLSALAHWPNAVNDFFSELEHQLQARIQELFDTRFRNWNGSQFYRESWTIVKGVLDNNFNEQRNVIAAEALKAELLRPYTIEDDIFNANKLAVMQRYQDGRYKARKLQFLREACEYLDRDLSPSERDRVVKEKAAYIKSEPYECELNLVADVTTYYMIAARRLVEGIMMRIDQKFFQVLRNGLLDQLRDELNIMSEQGPYIAQRLLTVSPARLERRIALEAKRNTLLEGLKCFHEHWQKYNAGASASNYQHPSISSPSAEEMDGVESNGLPIRSASRPVM